MYENNKRSNSSSKMWPYSLQRMCNAKCIDSWNLLFMLFTSRQLDWMLNDKWVHSAFIKGWLVSYWVWEAALMDLTVIEIGG